MKHFHLFLLAILISCKPDTSDNTMYVEGDITELRKNYIDRIYDTYIDENELQMCDKIICEIADKLDPKSYTSREFIFEIVTQPSEPRLLFII